LPLERRDFARSDSATSSLTPVGCSQSDSPACLSSATSETELSLPGFEAAPSSPEVSRVSLGPLPGSSAARLMTATSGRQLATFSRKSGQLGSLVRMCLESSAWGSSLCALTWKASATPRNRLLFQLVPSMPDTGAIESGLLPTAVASDAYGSGSRNTPGSKAHAGISLTDYVRQDGGTGRMWPTPAAQDGKNGTLPPSQMDRDTVPGAMLRSGARGQLNPAFVEWLMGYPIGHTALKASATRSSRKSRNASSTSSPRSSAKVRPND
jgi:hypothetical protein